MLTHPTVEKLQQLRCAGMAKALAEQVDSSEVDALSFEERLGLLVDRELTVRHSRQLTNRLRRAKLKHDACLEDIDFRHRRGLDKELVLSLADGRWVRDHLNVLICGPTGVGKSWIGCALAHSACRNGHSALYVRVSRLLSALAIARADGRYPKLLESLAKTEVLVMDDWGLAPHASPCFCRHQITPKTSRYTRCSMSMLPNVSINRRTRSSGQLGRWWYSISPCRNNECVRRFTVFAFNQRS